MEIKDFVKDVLRDLVDAVEEIRWNSPRDMHLSSNKETGQTVEFDIAVTVEDNTSSGWKAGIKVFSFAQAEWGTWKETKNSSVSRIKFWVYIDPSTKEENQIADAQMRRLNSQEY